MRAPAARESPHGKDASCGTRFLVRMSFNNKTFAAAVLDMAVRGYLSIKEQAGSYTLYRSKADVRVLTPDEKQIGAVLFDGRDQLWLHNENHTVIKAGITALKSWLKLAEDKIYFFSNRRYLIPGVLFSVAMVLGVAAMQSSLSLFGTVFISLWLSVWSLACAGLAIGCSSAWKAAFTAPSSKTLLAGKALVFTLFSLPFFAGEVMGLVFLVKFSSIFVALFLIISAFLHILFHYLLKAPTAAGRRLLDQVDGFKMFLGAVDGDRLNRVMPPDKTPETFEKFLPYALALDLEQAWSEKFSGKLGAAGQAPSTGAGYTLPFIPVRTGMVLPRQDFPVVLPAALPALSLPLRPLPDPRMVRAAPAAVVVGAAAGNFAADYQPVRYSRFRKSFAVAAFVTRIFSPS